MINNPLQSLLDVLPSIPSDSMGRSCKAQELVTSLVDDDKCYSTESGAMTFGEACATDVIYEDCYEAKPFLGKEVCYSFLV